MTAERRERWNEFLTSCSIAFGFGIFIIPFMPVPLLNRFVIWFLAGILFGVGFFTLGLIRPRVRLASFALNMLAHWLLTSCTIAICFLTMFYAMGIALQPAHILDPELYRMVTKMLIDNRVFILLAGAGGFLLSALITGTFQIERKMGPGVLWRWVTGKYYTPRSEELIFMFLDMRDSTTLGEKLGTLKFSALVRDVFSDLTYPLLDSKAKVSHFIGDEAVIYWPVEQGLRGANCVRLFFLFEKALLKRADYYRTTYGLMPEFKAGIHIGQVVATEVGEIKSEIVFHGDTLNTTARIQGMCNELGSLLMSEDLADRLEMPGDYVLCRLGPVTLKGKAEPVSLCSVEVHPI